MRLSCTVCAFLALGILNPNKSSCRSADDDTSRRVPSRPRRWGYVERTATTAAAELLIMILLQHSGRPVVKHVGPTGLHNFCVWCLRGFEAGNYGGFEVSTSLYAWYLVYA